jgi:hypothetical protein
LNKNKPLMNDFIEILSICLRRAGSAVSGIMGERLQFIEHPVKLVEGRDVLGRALSGQTLVRLAVSAAGEVAGDAWLIVSTADAIRLAGCLVMLPEVELEEAVAANDFEDEIHYAFVEMVNIVSVSFSKTFTELTGKPYRFQVVGQTKHLDDGPGDEHFFTQLYYRVAASMELGSQKMGQFMLLLPPQKMELDVHRISRQNIEKPDEVADEKNNGDCQTGPEEPNPEFEAFLSELRLLIGKEFSVLLGMEVSCFGKNGLLIDLPQPLLDPILRVQAAAHLKISGACNADAYLVADIEDAIRLAGHFVSLTASELEDAILNVTFDSELQDGFSETANIVAGLCTLLFERRYQTAVVFDKKEVLQTEPVPHQTNGKDQQIERMVDVSGTELAAENIQESTPQVYPVEIRLHVENAVLGCFHFLFPGQLADFIFSQAPFVAEQANEPPIETVSTPPDTDTNAALWEQEESAAPKILLISDSDQDSINIKEVFDRAAIGWTEIGFRDDVARLLPGAYSAIFLVSRQPDEQTFGVAIKVSSRCSLPLIVASSKWTQSSVFQAVRYGVNDILLTPASSEDVLEKLKMIINKQAA